LTVWSQVIAAETDAAARRLFTTSQQRFLRLIRNHPVELLPPVDSMEPRWQEMERMAVESKLGCGNRWVRSDREGGAGKLVRDTAADEVIVVTDTYAHGDRRQSYRRVVGVAAMIEVKPTVALKGNSFLQKIPFRPGPLGFLWCGQTIHDSANAFNGFRSLFRQQFFL